MTEQPGTVIGQIVVVAEAEVISAADVEQDIEQEDES